jgi:hypothetical protein
MMNERIRELAKQAGFYVTADKIYIPTISEEITIWQTKFAKLIVRECMEVAIHKDDGMISTADIAGYMASGRANAAKMIAKHFGVEE